MFVEISQDLTSNLSGQYCPNLRCHDGFERCIVAFVRVKGELRNLRFGGADVLESGGSLGRRLLQMEGDREWLVVPLVPIRRALVTVK